MSGDRLEVQGAGAVHSSNVQDRLERLGRSLSDLKQRAIEGLISSTVDARISQLNDPEFSKSGLAYYLKGENITADTGQAVLATMAFRSADLRKQLSPAELRAEAQKAQAEVADLITKVEKLSLANADALARFERGSDSERHTAENMQKVQQQLSELRATLQINLRRSIEALERGDEHTAALLGVGLAVTTTGNRSPQQFGEVLEAAQKKAVELSAELDAPAKWFRGPDPRRKHYDYVGALGEVFGDKSVAQSSLVIAGVDEFVVSAVAALGALRLWGKGVAATAEAEKIGGVVSGGKKAGLVAGWLTLGAGTAAGFIADDVIRLYARKWALDRTALVLHQEANVAGQQAEAAKQKAYAEFDVAKALVEVARKQHPGENLVIDGVKAYALATYELAQQKVQLETQLAQATDETEQEKLRQELKTLAVQQSELGNRAADVVNSPTEFLINGYGSIAGQLLTTLRERR